LNNNTWLTSTAYHPQTDGQTNTPKKWKVWQPFFLSFFFGLHTIWLLLLQSALLLIRLQELMDEKQKHIALIKQNLVAAHNWIKVQADKNCTDKEF
jgi:hypothetical protein